MVSHYCTKLGGKRQYCSRDIYIAANTAFLLPHLPISVTAYARSVHSRSCSNMKTFKHTFSSILNESSPALVTQALGKNL